MESTKPLTAQRGYEVSISLYKQSPQQSAWCLGPALPMLAAGGGDGRRPHCWSSGHQVLVRDAGSSRHQGSERGIPVVSHVQVQVDGGEAVCVMLGE